MKDKAGSSAEITPEMERIAAQKARDRATNARWDLNIAIFLFAVLILIIILVTYTKAGIEIVAPTAILGLGMVWAVGWRRGKQMYSRFYQEEIANLEQEEKRVLKNAIKDSVEETIEERVQKALRQRLK
jgi:Flp pilus assembly protein TadB